MKKFLALLFVVLVSAVTSYMVGQKTNNPAPESVYERVKRTGVIRCGYWVFPPVVVRDADTGAMTGPAPALFEELAKRLNLKVDWVEEVTFDTMTQGLHTGRYDAICTGSWLTARVAREAIFTSAYLYSELGVVVRADDTRFDAGMETLNQPNVRFAAQDDALSEVVASEFPQASITSVPSTLPTTQLYEDVATNKADAALADAGDLAGYQKQNPNKVKLIHIESPIRLYPWVIPVAPGEHDLVMMLDGALQEMVYAKQIQKIINASGIAPGTYGYVSPGISQ